MIRYNLVCDAAHVFECWFPSSESFEDQTSRRLVACPTCSSAKVSKAVMAPSVARRDRSAVPVPAPETTPGADAPMQMISEPERKIREMIRAIHAHVTAHSEHVGDRFSDEARKIHYGEAESRSIHGQASFDEARALIEEGIEVAPLPSLPDDRN